jgi:hypothetical protein
MTKTLFVIATVAIFSSCASIVSKCDWPLKVSTYPDGARIEITDKKGNVVFSGNSPAATTLRSGAGFFSKQSYKVKITLDGYYEKTIPVECSLNGWYAGNIFIGGLLGLLIVDPATGAMYKLNFDNINETLVKSTSDATTLRILNIKDVPENLKSQLISIN